jgi:hypothetical protein
LRINVALSCCQAKERKDFFTGCSLLKRALMQNKNAAGIIFTPGLHLI